MTLTHFVVLSLAALFLAGCGNTAASTKANHPTQHITSSIAPLSKMHENEPLFAYRWRHGSPNCDTQTAPELEVYKHNATTFIIRENKCGHFEAPFIYLLMGSEQALLIDTGTAEHSKDIPLAPTVNKLLNAYYSGSKPKLLVIHSHSHGDHVAGDPQFSQRANTIVVGAQQHDIQSFYQFDNNAKATLSLGDRNLTVLFTPGHQEEAVTIYDPKTQWLITGDTFYPGLVYVKHWQHYRESINRLAEFGQTHPVKAILGGHIEMHQTSGDIYPIGSTYQPEEHPLPLTFAHLTQINNALQEAEQPTEIKHNSIIIMPMNWTQSTLSNLFRWLF